MLGLLAGLGPVLDAQATARFGLAAPLWQSISLDTAGPFETASLEPIGWSRDGKFAYLTAVPAEGVGGGPWFSLVIQDLIEDTVVFVSPADFQRSIDAPYLDTPEFAAKPAETFWAYHQKEFQPMLDRFKIQWTGPAFATFPLRLGGETVQASLTSTRVMSTDLGIEQVKDYRISLRKLTAKTVKIAATKSLTPEEGPFMEIQLLGCFLSPFENRLALVLGTVKRGWEGPPHVRDFFLIGSHLDVGFKKD